MHDASATSGRRGRRRTIITLVIVAAVIVAGAGATAAYLALRTRGSPSQTAASYLHGWQHGSYQAMAAVTVNAPPGGLARPLQQAAAQLGVRGMRLKLGEVTSSGGTALARFTATDQLASGHAWVYRGQLRLVKRNRHWWVSWSPAAIYPGLRAGERFALRAVWPPRAQILAADGTVLSSPQAIAQSGSLSLLTGTVVAATASIWLPGPSIRMLMAAWPASWRWYACWIPPSPISSPA